MVLKKVIRESVNIIIELKVTVPGSVGIYSIIDLSSLYL